MAQPSKWPGPNRHPARPCSLARALFHPGRNMGLGQQSTAAARPAWATKQPARSRPSVRIRRPSAHLGRTKPPGRPRAETLASFPPSPSLSSRCAARRNSRSSSRPRWPREKKRGSAPRPLAGVRARPRLVTRPSRGRMVVPCCHDRGGSRLCPARRGGAVPFPHHGGDDGGREDPGRIPSPPSFLCSC